MRGRRSKRNTNNTNFYNCLRIISKFLIILIAICLIIFIVSSIKVKNKSKISKNQNDAITQSDDLNQTLKIEQNNTNSKENTATNSMENETIQSAQNTLPDSKQEQDTTITMALTGDIMCHNTIYNDAKINDTYDFSYIFENVKYYLQTPDITVGNLETTFAGSKKGYSSYPTFNTPENLAYTLKKLGFDVLSTANNHCYDSGYDGIESTINYLDDADISHTGTYKSAEEQNTILVKNVKGLKIAFLSFTYGTNGIKVPESKSYSVNLISEDLIKKQLELAKEQEPDIIFVSMHWGIEYQTTPNQEQKKWADFLFENGADIIIGNHPHVIQPMEKREITLQDGSVKDGFVVYSLGNFIADQNKTYTRDTAILNLKITKSKKQNLKIDSATYTPVYTYKNPNVKQQKFKLIDLKNVIASFDAGYDTTIGNTLYNTFKTELNNVKKLLGEEIR